MQTSSKKLTKKQQRQIIRQFATLLSDLQHPDECQIFFESFLTKTEQNVFTKRLGIIWMLHQKKSYEEIKKKLKVSSATISSSIRSTFTPKAYFFSRTRVIATAPFTPRYI